MRSKPAQTPEPVLFVGIRCTAGESVTGVRLESWNISVFGRSSVVLLDVFGVDVSCGFAFNVTEKKSNLFVYFSILIWMIKA